MLPRNPLLLQRHATNCSWQEKQFGIFGTRGNPALEIHLLTHAHVPLYNQCVILFSITAGRTPQVSSANCFKRHETKGASKTDTTTFQKSCCPHRTWMHVQIFRTSSVLLQIRPGKVHLCVRGESYYKYLHRSYWLSQQLPRVAECYVAIESHTFLLFIPVKLVDSSGTSHRTWFGHFLHGT